MKAAPCSICGRRHADPTPEAFFSLEAAKALVKTLEASIAEAEAAPAVQR